MPGDMSLYAYDSATSHFHVRYTSLDAGLKDNVNVIGFLEDDDRREVDAEAEHRIWFQNSAVENIKGGLNYNRYWSQQGELRSWEVDAEVETVFTSGRPGNADVRAHLLAEPRQLVHE